MPSTQEEIRDIRHKLNIMEGRINTAGGGAVGNHNILSAVHPDSVVGAAVAGDLIYANATPKWTRRPIGAGGTYLRSDGATPDWSALLLADLPAHAAEHEIGGGDLVDHDNLTNFVANEHIDHTAITLTAGVGLTGGGTIAANRTFDADVGITDNKIAQIDGVGVAVNDYAKFTANGLFGRSYDQVLADLSGEALAAFDWNDQALTSIGATELYGDIKTDRWLFQDSNTFIGVDVAGSGNLAHGGGNEGHDNVGVGFQALEDITTGYRNMAVGTAALSNNTTGYFNSAIGYAALASNIGGYHNVAIGQAALTANTDGIANVAIGGLALDANIGGDYSVAVGYNSLSANIGDGLNTAIGTSSLALNTTGTRNVAIGYNSAGAVTIGVRNVSIGYNALSSLTLGSYDVAVGYQALLLTTGTGNIGIGSQAGDNITSGHYNIVIGYNIDAPSATVSYQMNIGGFLHGKTDKHNLGLNTSTWGANADTVFAIKNGTPPDAAVADEIQIYSKDSSDGAANATLALMLEQAVEVIGTFTPSHKIKVWINGTEYWLQLDAV